jgi:hypothetical protein
MDLVLKRMRRDESGIYGNLIDSNDRLLAVTLEHAYWNDIVWETKIPSGVFTCVRGEHQLKGHDEPFITFEITGVSGHTGLLFHCGNFDEDSSGCILVGLNFGPNCIQNSRVAFERFMQVQEGLDSFQLTIL